jgi:hypothetical protein
MSHEIKTNRKVIAKICWVAAAEGGRPNSPLGPQYSTVARFDEEIEKWPKEAWSVVANFLGAPDETSCVEAELRFLSPDAPAYLLDPGSKFELYEGRHLVARGEVLRECVEKSPRAIRPQHLAVHLQET